MNVYVTDLLVHIYMQCQFDTKIFLNINLLFSFAYLLTFTCLAILQQILCLNAYHIGYHFLRHNINTLINFQPANIVSAVINMMTIHYFAVDKYFSMFTVA